jgi:hypothetical protein
MLGLQQFSGIDGVLYYAPVLFAQAGVMSQYSSFPRVNLFPPRVWRPKGILPCFWCLWDHQLLSDISCSILAGG